MADKTLLTGSGDYGINLEQLPEGYLLDNRYEIIEKLGKGGFGTVYKAKDHYLNNCYKAIKIISSQYYDDKLAMSQLKEEALRMIKLNHPNIVRLYDVHLDGDIRYLDMEYVDGGDLTDLMLKYPERKVPEEKVWQLIPQIISGMEHIHKHNIIHKDLKPQNIMLTNSEEIKISDFGISETFRSSLSRLKDTSRTGTPAYMSPEHLIGQNVGKESDIWSFGIMIYELLTGKLPYNGSSYADVLMQIREQGFSVVPVASKCMNKLLSDCLKYEYKNRIHNFSEIEKCLPDKSKINRNRKESPASKKPVKISVKLLTRLIIIALITTFLFIYVPKYLRSKKIDNLTSQTKIDKQNTKADDNIKQVIKPAPDLNEQNEKSGDIIKSDNTSRIKSENIKDMVFVQGGSFQMGSNDGENDEKPVHKVTLDDFFIGKYEVTQEDYKAVMGSNPAHDYWIGSNNPVYYVSWYDALEFCNKLSEIEGLDKCYSGSGKNIKCDFNANGYRLPTEAEWEFAARGGIKSKGYKYSGSNNINEVAKYFGNNKNSTKPVGGKKPNELGIYDMSGNVWEWCWDWKDNYSSSLQANPKGQDSGSFRLKRGGGWNSDASRCRVANRGGDSPGSSCHNLGFRLVRSSE